MRGYKDIQDDSLFEGIIDPPLKKALVEYITKELKKGGNRREIDYFGGFEVHVTHNAEIYFLKFLSPYDKIYKKYLLTNGFAITTDRFMFHLIDYTLDVLPRIDLLFKDIATMIVNLVSIGKLKDVYDFCKNNHEISKIQELRKGVDLMLINMIRGAVNE